MIITPRSLIQLTTLGYSLKKHFVQHQMDFPHQTSNESLQLTAGRRDNQLEFMKHIVDVAPLSGARSRPPEAGS